MVGRKNKKDVVGAREMQRIGKSSQMIRAYRMMSYHLAALHHLAACVLLTLFSAGPH